MNGRKKFHINLKNQPNAPDGERVVRERGRKEGRNRGEEKEKKKEERPARRRKRERGR